MKRTRQKLEDTKNLTEHGENPADTKSTWRTQQNIKGTSSDKENMRRTQQTRGGHEEEQRHVCSFGSGGTQSSETQHTIMRKHCVVDEQQNMAVLLDLAG